MEIKLTKYKDTIDRGETRYELKVERFFGNTPLKMIYRNSNLGETEVYFRENFKFKIKHNEKVSDKFNELQQLIDQFKRFIDKN